MLKQSGSKVQPEHSKMVLGKRQRSLLADSVHVEEEFMPAFVRPMLIITVAIVVMFFLWAALTQVAEVARAPGQIIPAGQAKSVQHLDGGVIEKIAIEERMLVQEGQELLRVDGREALAQLNQMQARLAALTLRSERLSAFAEEREPELVAVAGNYADLLADQQDIYRTQLATRNSTLSVLGKQIEQRKRRIVQQQQALNAAIKEKGITDEMVSMREDLAERKLVKRTILLETLRAKINVDSEVARIKEEIDVTRQELAEVEARRQDTLNQLRQDALNEMGVVRAEMAEVEETIRNLSARADRLVITAPARGYVNDLKVFSLGQVIQPGALLMQIVPDDVELEAEVRIQPKDVGYVQVNQPVNMRISSFDYARFGFATGTLKRVAATSAIGDDNVPYYRAWVTLDKPYVGRVPGQNLLQPGMGVDAEIVTGEKSLLAYLSKPVINVMTRSFHER